MDELIQDKIFDMDDASNFQSIDVLKLCRKFFPDLTSGTLENVHTFLGKKTEVVNGESYHTVLSH
jgi:hypothetical protein